MKAKGITILGVAALLGGIGMLVAGASNAVDIVRLRSAPYCPGPPEPHCIAQVDSFIEDYRVQSNYRGPDDYYVTVRIPPQTQEVQIAYGSDYEALLDESPLRSGARLWGGHPIALVTQYTDAITTKHPVHAAIYYLTLGLFCVALGLGTAFRGRLEDPATPFTFRAAVVASMVFSCALIFGLMFAEGRPRTMTIAATIGAIGGALAVKGARRQLTKAGPDSPS